MATVKLKLNSAGVRQLLKAPGVQADLERRGRKVAAAAGEGVEAHSDPRRGRAHVSVTTDTFEAKKAEANGRALSRAVDAARK